MELAITACIIGAIFLAVLSVQHPKHLGPIILAVGILSCRPSALGERLPWVGPLALVLGVLLSLATRNEGGERRPVKAWPMVVLFAAYVWLILREAMVGDDAFSLVSSTVTLFVPPFALALLAKRRDLLQRVSNVFVWLVTASSASVAVTMLVGLVVGYGALRLGTVPLGYERANSGLLLPFSLTYGSAQAGIPRFLGLGREPGMGALFIGYAFFAMPAVKRRWLYWLILLTALGATQSTAGIGVFAVCLGLYFILGQGRFKPAVAIVAGGLSTWAVNVALYDPKFGFLSKQELVSATDRTRATNAGIEAFLNDPVLASTSEPLSSINMVAGMAVTGAPFFVLMFLVLAAPILRDRLRNWQSYSALFMLVIMLTSQPLYGSAAIIVLALMTYYLIPGAGSSQEDSVRARTPLGRQRHPLATARATENATRP